MRRAPGRPQPAAWGSAHLVPLHVLRVGEVHDGGELVDVAALQPLGEEVPDQHGTHEGFSRPGGAVEGHNEGLLRAALLQEPPQSLHQLLPHQGLPHQGHGQLALQTCGKSKSFTKRRSDGSRPAVAPTPPCHPRPRMGT